MKYRERPVVIEAYQTIKPLRIKALEGEMLANPGDWIITGANGETYPCKPDIFEKTYEPVTDATPAVFTAADLAKAREEGRRDGLEGVRKIMTYDEAATSRGLGQGNTWDVIKRTYTIDADVFDALLAEGKKEASDDGPKAEID